MFRTFFAASFLARVAVENFAVENFAALQFCSFVSFDDNVIIETLLLLDCKTLLVSVFSASSALRKIRRATSVAR